MEHWLNKSVFYEIYPQSFFDSNGDGIGDLPGIIQKLDYIRALGCNALWLNPCFVSPFGDAGYDVADYCRVAPRYGTNEDLETLFASAHKRGMHVLLDLVPGHTSVEHPWFKESCSARPNPYSGRYIWSSSVWEDVTGYPNISGSLRGISPRDGSVAVNFFSHQPALNYGFARRTASWQSAVDSPEALATRRAMRDVMAFWLDKGCDGFRVDMAGSLVKDDEGSRETIKLWQEMRRYLDEAYPDAVLLSEWGEPDKSLAGGFHMDFLLHFGTSHYMDLFRCEHPYFSREGKGSATAFIETYRYNRQRTGGRGLMCIPSGNHDMERLRKYLDEEEMKLAFAFLLSMPGAPFIYYGDEIAMRHLARTSVEGGYFRTGARSPMQWDDSANYGFSAAPADKLYIAPDEAAGAPTAARAMADVHSLWQEIRRLIALRMEMPALQAEGGVEFLCDGDTYPLVYLRTAGSQKVLVCLNPSAQPASCVCPYAPARLLYSLGGLAGLAGGKLTMPGQSAAFWAVE